MALTLQSPGVAINEQDLSLFPVLPVGTSIFMTGFSPHGPTDEILEIDDIGTLEAVYGTPTTPAERYFYYTAAQIINSNAGTLLVNRLPYGDGLGDGLTEGEGDKDGLGDRLGDGDTLGETESDAEGETLADGDGLTEGEVEG